MSWDEWDDKTMMVTSILVVERETGTYEATLFAVKLWWNVW